MFCYVFNITNALCDVIEIFLSLCLECIWTLVIGLGVETELLYIKNAL